MSILKNCQQAVFLDILIYPDFYFKNREFPIL